MSYVSVDVETIHDESKVDLFKKFVDIPEDLLKRWSGLDGSYHDIEYPKWINSQMSLTPEYCKIVGLNWMTEDCLPASRWVGQSKGGEGTGEISEVDILRKFWILAKANSPIITFNGLSFDLEVLKMRSAILGVSATTDLANLKPWENKVIDLMKRMYSNRKAIGLKKIRKILWSELTIHEPGLLEYEDIMDMSGGEVNELYKAGDYAKLIRYGEFDALTNVALYKFGKGYWW